MMTMIQGSGEQEGLNCSDLLCRLNGSVDGGTRSWGGRRDVLLDGRTDWWVGRWVDDMKKIMIIFVLY